MIYTTAEILAIIAGIGGLFTVIGGVIVQIMTARVKLAVKDEVEKAIVPVMTETLAKTKVIEGHVNSDKSAADGRENTLKAENKMLIDQLMHERQIAALLAAKVPVPIQVINGPLPKTRPETPETGDIATRDSLDRIDTNTEAIKDNTTKANDDGL